MSQTLKQKKERRKKNWLKFIHMYDSTTITHKRLRYYMSSVLQNLLSHHQTFNGEFIHGHTGEISKIKFSRSGSRLPFLAHNTLSTTKFSLNTDVMLHTCKQEVFIWQKFVLSERLCSYWFVNFFFLFFIFLTASEKQTSTNWHKRPVLADIVSHPVRKGNQFLSLH